MNIDDLGRDAGRALSDAAQGAPIPPLEPRSIRTRNALAFAMSAAAVIVVIGVAALVGRTFVDGPEFDPADSSIITTTQPDGTDTTVPTSEAPVTTSTTVQSGPSIVFAENGWARGVFDVETPGDAQLVAVATSEVSGASVAVGTAAGGNPAAWSLSEGVWQVVAGASFDRPGEIVDVVADGRGFLAVGQADGVPTMWRSVDGGDFTVDSQLPMGGQASFPSSITISNNTLIVVGVQFEGDGVSHEDNMDGVVWLRDSDNWEIVSSASFATPGFAAGDPVTRLDDVTVGTAGLVAVGFQDDAPAMWISSAGSDWERVTLAVDAKLEGVAFLGGRYLAWGAMPFRGSPDSAGVILSSADGRTWQPVSGDFTGARGQDGYQKIEAVGFNSLLGYYAVGSDHREFTSIGAAAVWRSINGVDWVRVDHDDDVFGSFTEFGYSTMTDITITTGGVIAVGVTGVAVEDAGGTRCCDLSPAVWIGRPSE